VDQFIDASDSRAIKADLLITWMIRARSSIQTQLNSDKLRLTQQHFHCDLQARPPNTTDCIKKLDFWARMRQKSAVSWVETSKEEAK
jgi:hypothetical protein